MKAKIERKPRKRENKQAQKTSDTAIDSLIGSKVPESSVKIVTKRLLATNSWLAFLGPSVASL